LKNTETEFEWDFDGLMKQVYIEKTETRESEEIWRRLLQRSFVCFGSKFLIVEEVGHYLGNNETN
jgi:hypothetical protein